VNVKLRKLALAIRYQWSSASAAALVIPAESDNSRTDGNTRRKISCTDSTGDGCNRTRASIFHAPEHFVSSGDEREKLQNRLN
jgi:hypothetical protein